VSVVPTVSVGWTVVLSSDHGHVGSLKRTDGSEHLLSGEQLLLWASRRCGWVTALSIERREFLLAGVDLRAFNLPLVIVEGNVVIRLGSFEDTPNLRFRDVKERGGRLLLPAFADLADEILDMNVLFGELLEETVLDSVAIRWPADALPVGDGGVDALPNTRADHLP
jgi:hypothetical protein